MRDVAVIGTSLLPTTYGSTASEVELVQAVVSDALAKAGVERSQVDFWCSGSADMLVGRPFTFVSALDAIGAWPPIAESHVEMDGAFALYEAWVRLLHGDTHVAVVYCFGQSSQGDVRKVLTTQFDPYWVTPLWPDTISVAAMQAQALLDTGRYTERDFAAVAERSRNAAAGNERAQLRSSAAVDTLLQEPHIVRPLRRHACPPIGDGAGAIVLATEEGLARIGARPAAWIRGMDHRIEAHELGARVLTDSPSTRLAAQQAGLGDGPVDLAELHAPFAPQELILRDALGLPEQTRINVSGGALAANPIMVAGLARIAEAAERVMAGDSKRALAHATSGPALQQNLVCIMEGRA